ncbi:MAG: HAMP domain-containing histidine kinase [Saccharospirillaceae bacterium]|nr:HAMP domain-containing histidine kinase [Saccharospirillaceae bacterium]
MQLRLESDTAQQSLNDIVEAVIKQFRNEYDSKSVELIYLKGENVPAWINVDASLLTSCLKSLIKNALDHTVKGEVLVLIHLDDSVQAETKLRLNVSDTGEGIDSNTVRHIENMMLNPKEPVKKNVLAKCTKEVRHMGGHIGLRSTLSRGTTIWLDVPINLNESMMERRKDPVFEQGVVFASHSTNQTALLRYIAPLCKSSKIVRTQMDISVLNNNHPIDLVVIQGKIPDLSQINAKKIIYIGDVNSQHPDDYILPKNVQYMSKPVLPSDFEKIRIQHENDFSFEIAQSM